MKIKNKKGFGLVMAIMIITVLLIMAAGFFQVTDYSTKSVTLNEQNLRLYWAAESASNFNVSWWASQPEEVRITWPSVYTAPVGTTKGAEKGNAQYADVNAYRVEDDKFPNGDGIALDGFLYLHASSVLEIGANPVIDGYKVVTTRYKGQRTGKPEEAVWVLDSYVWDQKTGDIANITLTNVWNTIVFSELEWLANSEAIVRSMYGTGWNGALGAFHEKDVRYGPCYYADIMRFDLQTSGSTGARFFGGPVKSSARRSLETTAMAPYVGSRWGNAQLENMTGLFNTDHMYGYGVSIKANFANENAAALAFDKILNNGTTPYFKDEAPLSTENVTWTWTDVKEEGPAKGIYLLPETGSGNVTITLKSDGNGSTKAILSNPSVEIPLGKGTGTYNGVAVPKNYGTVSISGVSNKDFTLVTEADQVNITGDLYIEEMKATDTWLDTQFIQQNQTSETVLKKIWENMGNTNSKTKLSIISQLNPDETPSGDPFYLSPSRAGIIFTTVAMLTRDGLLNLPANLRTNTSMKYINVGSVITLNHQGVDGGDASGKWTKALIQDQRYLQPGFGIPDFWGAGPTVTAQSSLFGLNKEHRWNRHSTQKTDDWNKVVWKPINGSATPSF